LSEDLDSQIGRTEIERIQRLSEAELDQLPFGAVRLDREGRVLAYNRAEAELSGLGRERALGRNFFTEVAPSTDVPEFAGRFREGVRAGRLHTTFPYVLDHQVEPRNVWVTLFYSPESDTGWLFLRDDRRLSAPD
jgi:photoactive yellow protein